MTNNKSVSESTDDIAGHDYWESMWSGMTLPDRVEPNDQSLANFVVTEYDKLFKHLLPRTRGKDFRMLEIGCAGSVWLPYFATEFGFSVEGLDYSPSGSASARAVLAREGVDAAVHCDDMFSPPEELMGRFDFVSSYGVAEHFEDTSVAINAMAAFLKPGGHLITLVPNLSGLLGTIQKNVCSREIYDKHVPMNADQLRDANEKAGLKIVDCQYFLQGNFHILTFGEREGQGLVRHLGRSRGLLSRAFFTLSRYGAISQATRFWASNIYCLAKKPD